MLNTQGIGDAEKFTNLTSSNTDQAHTRNASRAHQAHTLTANQSIFTLCITAITVTRKGGTQLGQHRGVAIDLRPVAVDQCISGV